MARFVPERMDDFVWENDLVCYRAYGKALEGNPTSPGFDIWVKTPGALVADSRYEGYLSEGDKFYHTDHGNGKDCYKVSVSLGGGASAPYADGVLVYPETNFRSWEIVSQSADKVVFILSYPAWEVYGCKVALDKKITVVKGSHFCSVEDSYTGDFDSLTVAAGFFRHEVADEMSSADRLAIWEKPSDTSFEPEDSYIGVGLVMPDADSISVRDCSGKMHSLAFKTIVPGEKVCYSFGSCWSRGNVKTAEEWFSTVAGQK